MLPKDIKSSGFPRVRETCRTIGITFDPWQTDLNRCILAKTADGLYAADTVVMSIPRQVGKTFDVGAIVFAECIANPGTTVVWTAHRFKVARETFTALRALAKSPLLIPHLDYDEITTAAGNECIPFRNGSRIVFAARERGAIRGFTKVQILILDEAQILTESALADLAPTMNQAENPQIILMGTPPKPTDPGEVFTNLRNEALSGDSEGLLYVEFSGDPDAGLDNRQVWKQANPSYPDRTSARAILRMRKLLSEEDFAREALGIWDSAAFKAVIPRPSWIGCLEPASSITGGHRFAFDVSPTQDSAALAVAGPNVDNRLHVEITSRKGVIDHRPGTDWVVARVKQLHAAHPNVPLAYIVGSAAAALVPALEKTGITIEPVPNADVPAACGLFYNAATAPDPELAHLGQPVLDQAVTDARRQFIADKTFVWARRKSAGDITPLYAVTVAGWAAHKAIQADYDVADSIY